jgi:hypothetical protein
MFILTHKIESVFLIIVTAMACLFLAISINKPELKIFPTRTAIEANSIETSLPTEIPIPESTVSEISSDGTKKVVLKTIQNKDETKSVILSIEDSGSGEQQVIFEVTLKKGKSIVIPYNTWSPDNKYFFIQENTSTGTEIRVFNAKGESFASGETYLDLTGLFGKLEIGNNFSEATGWASETLIIVNTTSQDDTKGPSYWFEVPRRAIMQLSTEF